MRCCIVPTVSEAELLRLTTTSAGTRPADGRLRCELVAGHQGSHIGFATAALDGDQWWWLRWDELSGDVGEMIQIDPCDSVLPQGRYADDCVLPQGHPGPHSFDVPPAPPVIARRHPVRLRSGRKTRWHSRRNPG